MKMSDVFKLPVVGISEWSEYHAATFSYFNSGGYDLQGKSHMEAAAHAINQHDALVAMNAELVEALEGCLSDLLMHQGEKKGSGTCWAGEAEEALAKAKELSQ